MVAVVAFAFSLSLAAILASSAPRHREFASCEEPRDGETLLITVTKRSGKIVATCTPLTGSNSAARARGRIVRQAAR